MIEKSYLAEGHQISIPGDLLRELPPPATQPVGQPVGFVEQAVRRQLRDNHGQAFDWLAYVPDWMNHIAFAGRDVVSGPFTGCWMIYFTLNGVQRIGHLGLPDAGAAGAKSNWRVFARTAPAVAQFRAFKPANLAADPAFVRASTSGAYSGFKFLGLMTQERQCFSIAIGLERNNVYRVIRVLHTTPEASLVGAWPP